MTSTFKHLRAIILLPGVVTIIVPGLLIAVTRTIQTGWSLIEPLNWILIGTGVVLIAFGLVLVIKTISLLAKIGQGTLAPWDPTHKLVVQGIYRFVRNPMISGVFCIVLGETLILGSMLMMYELIIFAVLNLFYIPLIEEPGLVDRFGDEYRQYKQHVPRWIPHSKPWIPN
ncbi:MAG TPA: isoprenylcysteine carboxylmethyltransferase family protein [Anaerolineae bacterium]|nr:isoprenylcysteine carboxylmethyltransferase family protein [Anaerolineae bacterium]